MLDSSPSITTSALSKWAMAFANLRRAVMLHALVEIADHVHQLGKGLLGVIVEHLIDADRLGLALDHDLVDVADTIGALQAANVFSLIRMRAE